MTPTPDTTPAAVEAMCERLLAGDLCTVELAPVAAAMLREVARERDKTRAAIESQASAIRNLRANEESEINILRSRSRDHYIATATLDSEREANARLTDALLAAEAEAAALREALEQIERTPAWGYPERWETTPAEVRQLARAALKEPSHED